MDRVDISALIWIQSNKAQRMLLLFWLQVTISTSLHAIEIMAMKTSLNTATWRSYHFDFFTSLYGNWPAIFIKHIDASTRVCEAINTRYLTKILTMSDNSFWYLLMWMDANSTWIEDPHTYIERYGVENKRYWPLNGLSSSCYEQFRTKNG